MSGCADPIAGGPTPRPVEHGPRPQWPGRSRCRLATARWAARSVRRMFASTSASPMVGLLASRAVAVTVAGDCQGIDREHLPSCAAQAGHQQAARPLDRHWDRVGWRFSDSYQQFQQLAQASRVVIHSGLDQQLAGLVDHCHVMVPLRPVNPAERVQAMPPRVQVPCGQSHGGARSSLIEGLSGPTSDQPSATPVILENPV